ncbi:MAG: RNA 2',3'-cyclic phosphodiesterase [Actinomycetia bacterium]|nr:RNA 2',3'-cyclic phosphodiesterase [Actinomycetes bacterium]
MSVRSFLGIALEPHVRDSLEACMTSISAESPAWRAEKWVPSENLHVTIEFLGSVEDTALEDVRAAVAGVCADARAYPLSLDTVKPVPRARAASMLWATLAEGDSPTCALAKAIGRALAPLGFEPPARPFSAHVTLARARRPRPIELEALEAGNRSLLERDATEKRMSVRGITLYASTRTRHAPVYREIAFVPFAGD